MNVESTLLSKGSDCRQIRRISKFACSFFILKTFRVFFRNPLPFRRCLPSLIFECVRKSVHKMKGNINDVRKGLHFFEAYTYVY